MKQDKFYDWVISRNGDDEQLKVTCKVRSINSLLISELKDEITGVIAKIDPRKCQTVISNLKWLLFMRYCFMYINVVTNT